MRRFKALGHGDRIIPIIVEGEPGDPAYDCFPPALRFRLGSDGQLSPMSARSRSLPTHGRTVTAGNVMLAQLNPMETLTFFRNSLGIRERLAAAYPNNSDWQFDLSVSHDKVGNVLVAQRNSAEALNRSAPASRLRTGWPRP